MLKRTIGLVYEIIRMLANRCPLDIWESQKVTNTVVFFFNEHYLLCRSVGVHCDEDMLLSV